uniref:Putative secreted protein n=1 Tax=Ixodes ricinus TaxID=34613 RepID=A0A6B0UPG9_IXORI
MAFSTLSAMSFVVTMALFAGGSFLAERCEVQSLLDHRSQVPSLVGVRSRPCGCPPKWRRKDLSGDSLRSTSYPQATADKAAARSPYAYRTRTTLHGHTVRTHARTDRRRVVKERGGNSQDVFSL